MNTRSYFSHDSNARSDEKILKLRMQMGAEGYGIYFMLLERMREDPNYMSVTDYNVLAFDLRVDAGKIKRVAEEFGLFKLTEDGNFFYSESFISRMQIKDEKQNNISEVRRKAAQARWEKEKGESKSDDECISNANAQKIDAKSCQEKKRKEKENKERKEKEEKQTKEKQSKDFLTGDKSEPESTLESIQAMCASFCRSLNEEDITILCELQKTYRAEHIKRAMAIATDRGNRSMKYVRGILEKQLKQKEITQKRDFKEEAEKWRSGTLGGES